jgi:hypothetical protein
LHTLPHPKWVGKTKYQWVTDGISFATLWGVTEKVAGCELRIAAAAGHNISGIHC